MSAAVECALVRLAGGNGKFESVHKRFIRWADKVVWERIFAVLNRDRDNEYLMIDGTIVRAHPQATSRKGRLKIRR